MSARCWMTFARCKDVIFRKYQRRRASAEDVDSIEKLIQRNMNESE